MLNTAVTRVPTTIAERYAALIAWLRARGVATAPADRGAVTPIWELESGAYRMSSCATCGEIVNPASRLCRSCGNDARKL
jgi:hypothetical protein